MRQILFASVLLLTSCASMKEGFEKGFDKSFSESCRAEAVKKVNDQKVADKFCDCALAKFKQTKSMDQSTKACNEELGLSKK